MEKKNGECASNSVRKMRKLERKFLKRFMYNVITMGHKCYGEFELKHRYDWVRRFKEGRALVKDDSHSDRSFTSPSGEIGKVRQKN